MKAKNINIIIYKILQYFYNFLIYVFRQKVKSILEKKKKPKFNSKLVYTLYI